MENVLITVPDKDMPNLVRIQYKKGGETPDTLKGLYTGWTMAKKAIDCYNTLKPVHEPQVYSKQKNITDEEEAKLFAKVEEKVKEKNEALEAKQDVKEKVTKTKNEGGAEHLRKGLDYRSESFNLSRERKPS